MLTLRKTFFRVGERAEHAALATVTRRMCRKTVANALCERLALVPLAAFRTVALSMSPGLLDAFLVRQLLSFRRASSSSAGAAGVRDGGWAGLARAGDEEGRREGTEG